MRRTVSDSTQNQSLGVHGEASLRFLDRTQREIQMRTRISVLQTEIQRQNAIIQGRDELLHHTQREIEGKDEIIRHQRDQILSLALERDYLKSARDPFPEHSYSFMSEDDFPPRPRPPDLVAPRNLVDARHRLPSPQSRYRDTAENSISAPQSASLSIPALPPIVLPPPWSETCEDISFEGPGLQAVQMVSNRRLAPIEPRQSTLRNILNI